LASFQLWLESSGFGCGFCAALSIFSFDQPAASIQGPSKSPLLGWLVLAVRVTLVRSVVKKCDRCKDLM